MLTALALLLLLALSGCDDVPPPDADEVAPPARLSGTPSYDARAEPAAAVLPLVPASATTLAVTDLDEVRRQLGVPELTSDEPLADRLRFWDRARAEAPLLTAGLLRPDGPSAPSRGLSEDDVDWAARFSGPGGRGFVLALRPDLDLGPVRRAVAHGIPGLPGTRVLASDHLVVSGTTDDGHASWATDPTVVGLVGDDAEATYVRRGCVPLADALGPDVTAAQGHRVAAQAADLDPLDAFAVAFGDHVATVRVAPGRTDLFDRLHLGDHWPARQPGAAFRSGVGDPASGRIGYDVPRPPLAARLVLGGQLPFAVCNR